MTQSNAYRSHWLFETDNLKRILHVFQMFSQEIAHRLLTFHIIYITKNTHYFFLILVHLYVSELSVASILRELEHWYLVVSWKPTAVVGFSGFVEDSLVAFGCFLLFGWIASLTLSLLLFSILWNFLKTITNKYFDSL